MSIYWSPDEGDAPAVDVSFVMPCLNEAQSLTACLAMIAEAQDLLARGLGFTSEVIVADNGSTDGSRELAIAGGARLVPVDERGYGAALRGGFDAARGRFLVMGDADGSYDFREGVGLVARLADGADLCMGSRFAGGIRPGAMPWLNRHVGNPVLTGLLRLMFRSQVSDAHCGLRALTRACYRRLGLEGSGMEFASEMVIKAELLGCRIAEAPVTLSPDLRERPPHLRPWRDGWRHLRYLFMLSPVWLFAVPAGAACLLSLAIFAAIGLGQLGIVPPFFGNYWAIFAAALMGLGHSAGIIGLASSLYGVRQGYRRTRPWVARLAPLLRLETMLLAGLAMIGIGMVLLVSVALAWGARNFAGTDSVVPAVVGTLMLTLGFQNALGGFLLAIVGGNEARFLRRSAPVIPLSRPGMSLP